MNDIEKLISCILLLIVVASIIFIAGVASIMAIGIIIAFIPVSLFCHFVFREKKICKNCKHEGYDFSICPKCHYNNLQNCTHEEYIEKIKRGE